MQAVRIAIRNYYLLFFLKCMIGCFLFLDSKDRPTPPWRVRHMCTTQEHGQTWVIYKSLMLSIDRYDRFIINAVRGSCCVQNHNLFAGIVWRKLWTGQIYGFVPVVKKLLAWKYRKHLEDTTLKSYLSTLISAENLSTTHVLKILLTLTSFLWCSWLICKGFRSWLWKSPFFLSGESERK